MPAKVETMSYIREKPWHGLGIRMEDAPGSREALKLVRLDRQAIQGSIATIDGQAISGFKANIQNTNSRVLGVVADHYKAVQSEDAFAFIDQLLGEDVICETVGSLQDGRRTWLLAKLPQQYIVGEDEIAPYMVFMNTHDGTGVIRVTMIPVHVAYMNALNLALSTVKHPWSINRTGDITGKMEGARYTFLCVDRYISELRKVVDHMKRLRPSECQVMECIDTLSPLYDNSTPQR